jgi:hypothetical protein
LDEIALYGGGFAFDGAWRCDTRLGITSRGIEERHRSIQNGRIGDARRFYIAQRAKRPTGVIVGTRIRGGVILCIEKHVDDAAVGLIHADEITAKRNLGCSLLLRLFRAGIIFGLFRFSAL